MKYLLLLIIFISTSIGSFAGNDIYRDSQQGPRFIENKGQWNADIKFASRMPGINVVVKNDAIVYDFYHYSDGRISGQVIAMEFRGLTGKTSTIAQGSLPGTYNYFRGQDQTKWITGVRACQEVVLKNINNSIDAVVKFEGNLPRYDFLVRPGADPSAISLDIKGANSVRLDNDKGLVISTDLGEVVHGRIFAFQETAGLIKKIPCRFVSNKGAIGFELGDYDKSRPLIIDPVVFSTYLGGEAEDEVTDIASGKNGVFAVCGWTKSPDFNLTTGSYTTNYVNEKDIFVDKYSIIGTTSTLVFSTIIGGGLSEEATAVGIDAENNIGVAGFTNSGDFPKKDGFGMGYSKDNDPFLLKLKSDGTALMFSVCFGGSKDDVATDMKIATDGSFYISGYTNSANFPLQSAAQNALKGLYDIFISVVSNNGQALEMSTYFGGAAVDKGYAIDVDGEGNAYVTGETSSGDFPIGPYENWGGWYISKSPFDASYNGGLDAFVVKMGSGGKVEYATFFGGSSDDVGRSIAADIDGTVFFSGETSKEAGERKFPISDNAYQRENKGGTDGFIAKLDNLKVAGDWYHTVSQPMVFSTFFGQSGDEKVEDMAYDSKSSYLFVAGSTSSTKYPELSDKLLSIHGKTDAYISRFNKIGSEMNFSALIGGSDDDKAKSVAVDDRGDAYIGGATNSKDFPIVNNDLQSKTGGMTDGFISKIAFGSISLSSPLGQEEFCPDMKVSVRWNYTGISPQDKFNIEIQKSGSSQWTLLSDNISGGSYDWVLSPEVPAGDYKIRVYHKSGLNDILQKPITILSSPVISNVVKSPESLTLCQGEELKFTASAQGKGLSYQWKFNNKPIENSNDSVLVISNAKTENSGSYSLVVNGTCNPSAQSESFAVTVNPETKVMNVFNDTTLQAGSSTQFTVNAKGVGLAYEWQLNGVKLTGKNEATLTLTNVTLGSEGMYKCLVTGGCGSDQSNEFKISVDTSTTGMQDNVYNVGSLNVSVSTNKDMNLNVRIVSPEVCSATIRLTDNLGRLVANVYDGPISQGINNIDYNTSLLTNGIYWMSIECGENRTMNKISIVR